MALVAYSDESDYSEEEENQTDTLKSLSLSDSKSSNKILGSNSNHENKAHSCLPCKTLLSVDSIEIDDEDDNFVAPAPKSNSRVRASSRLLASLPAASSAQLRSAELAINIDDDDQLTDVPTKETWQPAQEVLLRKGTEKQGTVPNASPAVAAGGRRSEGSAAGLTKAQQMALASSALSSLLVEKRTRGGKIQLQLPPMSEFAEEDDLEDPERMADSGEAVRAKLGPSNTGTGLFSLLPKPRNATKGKEANRSLVPHVLSKPAKKHVPSRKKNHRGAVVGSGSIVAAGGQLEAKCGLGDYEASDDEGDYTSDFFSLESDNSIIVPLDTTPISSDSSLISNELIEATERLPSVSAVASGSITGSNSNPLSSNNYQSNDGYDDRSGQPMSAPVPAAAGHMALTNSAAGGGSQNSEDPLDPRLMDDEAWRRLTGKKRKAEDLDIIDFNPDDTLLSRDELMNQVISQQKPIQSHSKKKGNLPSQQQRRKHQITYLAHQAKEREIELQNEWSTGKAKKMQTRAKYGF